MITRDDRDILRKALSNGPKTTTDVQTFGWGRGAWNKLKEFKDAGYTDHVGNPRLPFTDMGAILWCLTPGGVTKLAQPEPIASTERFLRYGAWCACERSCNAATLVFEIGVSVYECHLIGAHWHPIDSRALSKNERTLDWQPWFLVSGEVQAGTGSDGEPLLKNVVPVSSLVWNQAQRRFTVVNLVPFQHEPHPGRGTPAGCACQVTAAP